MARYAFVIDARRCIGCKACMVACKAEWEVPVGLSRNWVHDTGVQGTFPDLWKEFVTGNCMHCARPPCIKVCPSGATYQRPDGIVVIDEDSCLGCAQCVPACPYGARFYNPEKGLAEKCNACLPRIERGQQPACVETCIGGARLFGDLDDPDSPVSRALRANQGEITRLVSAQVDTAPQIYYIGLRHVPAGLLPLPRQPMLTAAGATWKNAVIPVVGAMVGVSFVGQAIAFANQLRKGEEELGEY